MTERWVGIRRQLLVGVLNRPDLLDSPGFKTVYIEEREVVVMYYFRFVIAMYVLWFVVHFLPPLLFFLPLLLLVILVFFLFLFVRSSFTSLLFFCFCSVLVVLVNGSRGGRWSRRNITYHKCLLSLCLFVVHLCYSFVFGSDLVLVNGSGWGGRGARAKRSTNVSSNYKSFCFIWWDSGVPFHLWNSLPH